jgi:hypothetical protein
MPDLRFDPSADTETGIHPLAERLCGVASSADDIGIGADAPLVSPGSPGDWSDVGSGGSVLYLRMAAREGIEGTSGSMPPIGTTRIDEDHGLPLVSGFIESLACP